MFLQDENKRVGVKPIRTESGDKMWWLPYHFFDLNIEQAVLLHKFLVLYCRLFAVMAAVWSQDPCWEDGWAEDPRSHPRSEAILARVVVFPSPKAGHQPAVCIRCKRISCKPAYLPTLRIGLQTQPNGPKQTQPMQSKPNPSNSAPALLAARQAAAHALGAHGHSRGFGEDEEIGGVKCGKPQERPKKRKTGRPLKKIHKVERIKGENKKLVWLTIFDVSWICKNTNILMSQRICRGLWLV